MLGAIIGDIIGSPYEFDMNNIKRTDFILFSSKSYFTDDSILTIAVAEALIDSGLDELKFEKELINKLKEYGKRYPNAGYGGRFIGWLMSDNPKPYGSFGNGSAMRVSSIGWLLDNLDDVELFAEISAKVTHNHPEGIKGAKAVAGAIYLARMGFNKKQIRKYIVDNYSYDLSKTCDEIRPTYHHVESCQETMPQALTAFFEGASFEDCVRLAVSLGGDSDTLTCITASIAEAYYGIPDFIKKIGYSYLDGFLKDKVEKYKYFVSKNRKHKKIFIDNLEKVLPCLEQAMLYKDMYKTDFENWRDIIILGKAGRKIYDYVLETGLGRDYKKLYDLIEFDKYNEKYIDIVKNAPKGILYAIITDIVMINHVSEGTLEYYCQNDTFVEVIRELMRNLNHNHNAKTHASKRVMLDSGE